METESQPQPPPPPPPRPRRFRVPLPLAAAAAAAAVAAVFVVKAVTDDDGKGDAGTLRGPEGSEFTMRKPPGWSELSDVELEALRGAPLAVMRRDDGQALVVVNAQQTPVGDLTRLSRQLDRRLKQALRDFRRVSARTVQVKAGRALLYSYVRRRKGTAHSLLVIPAGTRRSYSVNAVVAAGADDVARQVGTMLLSFDT